MVTPEDDVRPFSAVERFWEAGVRGAAIAMAGHVGFLALFLALDLRLLATVNVASIVAYAAVLACVRRRRYAWAMPLVVAELVVHAALAGLVLGWDAGFGYYPLLLIPIALQSEHSLAHRLSVAGFLALAFTGMSLWLEGADPQADVSRPLVLGLRLLNLAVFFAVLVYLSYFYAQTVTRAENRLRTVAERDHLTGLANRGRLLAFAEDLARTPVRGGGSWLVFLDIDHFKVINDRHGHVGGDDVIRFVADRITAVLRAQDLAARWGGEEFLVLLTGTDRDGAVAVAERIRVAVARAGAAPGLGRTRLTVTAGVAEWGAGEDLDTALARADAALYRGKTSGRDRVETTG